MQDLDHVREVLTTMNMRLVDDYYAIEVSDDGEWYGDEYLGERPCAEATAALVFAQHRSEPSGVLTWSSKQKAKRALATARRVQKIEPAVAVRR